MNFEFKTKNSINLSQIKPYNNVPDNDNKFKYNVYNEINYDTKAAFDKNNKKSNMKLSFFSFDVAKKTEEQLNASIKAHQEKYFNTDKFSKYPIFRDLLVRDKFVYMPNANSRYAAQGVCAVGKTTLITSYDTSYERSGKKKNKLKSIVDVVDEYGRKKTIQLDNTSHVGGISYYENGGKVYISGEGCVNCYNITDLASATGDVILKAAKTYNLNPSKDGIDRASYLTVYGDNLYVGKFNKEKSDNLAKYKLDEEGNMVLDKIYKVPYKKVQGMCIYNYNGEDYYFFSCSSGRKSDSSLIVATLAGDSFKTVGGIPLPCLSEQISIDDEGNLMIVFESDCCKYGDGADGEGKSTKQIGSVCYLNTEDVILNANKNLLAFSRTDYLSYIGDYARYGFEWVEDKAIKSWKGIKEAANTGAEFAGEVISDIGDGIEDLYEGAKDFASDIYEGAKDFASDIYEGTKDFLSDAGDFFSSW